MNDYDIVIGSQEDKERILYFIDNYWKKGHSLVKSSSLFDFQHQDSINKNYNFILAKSDDIGWPGIVALMGFIPTHQYDPSLQKNGDYWGAIWKKREDIIDERFKSTGFDVYQRIYEEPNFHSYAAIGISKVALKIYRFWGCKIGSLSQYYILNNTLSRYSIVSGVNSVFYSPINGYVSEKDWEIREFDEKELNGLTLSPYYRPLKSLAYIINRYVKHPIYKYKFLGVIKSGAVVTLLVIREMHVNGAKSIRIVDVLGKLQGSLYEEFVSYLKRINAEYVDIMNYGIDSSVFYQMGFRKLDIEGDLIIPNYFEPFEQCNVKIDIAWKADYDNYVVFKGDSDQDRPNIL